MDTHLPNNAALLPKAVILFLCFKSLWKINKQYKQNQYCASPQVSDKIKYRVINRKSSIVINFKIAALKIRLSNVLQVGPNGEIVACGFEHFGGSYHSPCY
jgi:hypothetical protein